MNGKPRLSFWQIWKMSFGFLGIQFGWGLQMANMSAIYQFLGADESDIAFLWLAAPLTGLLVQPVIGYMSDRTWTRLGRRRPYFLVGAIFASLALIAMPNSSALWMAAGLLWILDASVNISMEPFRAFVGDLLPPEQRKTGFATQSLLIGAGAVFASLLPWLLTNVFGMQGTSPDIILVAADAARLPVSLSSAIPATVHLAFYIGAAIFFAAVLCTILTTREHPPADMEAFRRMKEQSSGVGAVFTEIIQGILSMPRTMKQLSVVQFFTWFGLFCMWIYFVPAVGKKVFDGQPLGAEGSAAEQVADESNLHLLAAAKATLAEVRENDSGGPVELGIDRYFERFVELAAERPDAGGMTPLEKRNPLYTTTAAIFLEGGAPHEMAEMLRKRLEAAERFRQGTEWGGFCFGIYNGVAFFFSFLLLALVRHFSARGIHIACLALGGVGLAAAAFVTSDKALLGPMFLLGIAWASILSMPYAMLSNVIPGDKMGFYMGVFNFFIVLPQILASLGMGPVVGMWLGGDGMNAVLLGGVSLVAAAAACFIVSPEVETGTLEQP